MEGQANKNRDIDTLCVNTIRMLSIEGVEQANSGHPGLPMGAAPMAFALWDRIMRHNPANPRWFNRDRFVLSAGHGSMLLYSLLHLYGYGLPLDELKRFRAWGSLTPGHPEFGHTPGVEATTGPLGQGIAMAAGMAMAERHLAAMYNKENFPIVDHLTFCLCGDGDLMEGVAAEAASLAGHLGLGRLIVLYDSNDISLDGKTEMAFTEKVGERFSAYGWQVLRVEDGNDLAALEHTIRAAVQETSRPSLVEVKTTIGYGSPNKGGTSEAHGAPLGQGEVALVRQNYDWELPSFEIPPGASEHFAQSVAKGKQAEADWRKLWEGYRQAYPVDALQLEEAMCGKLPDGWSEGLPRFEQAGQKVATRDASGQALNAIASRIPYFWGGSADLASSNKTMLKGEGDFGPDNYKGRNIWFGVREHAMGAMLNGISLHGGLRVFGGTFFVFSDYMKPAMRLAALMKQPVIYVLTHDSIAVGEDGPTHEPVEQLPCLRSMPGMIVFRPADANETVQAYKYAVHEADGPAALVLSRQGLPTLPDSARLAQDHIAHGAYVLKDCGATPEQLLLLATGSEVSLALQVQTMLQERGIGARVVSMPSWELFERQSAAYKEAVLPGRIEKRVAIEMASPFGWERYIGRDGLMIGISTYGSSAPGERLLQEFGFAADRIFARIIERYFPNGDKSETASAR